MFYNPLFEKYAWCPICNIKNEFIWVDPNKYLPPIRNLIQERKMFYISSVCPKCKEVHTQFFISG